MKPTFALNITDDGFVLLHRTAKGWTSVGETLYSAPDLPEAMAYLRNTALGLQPKGMTTKLVIPNSQILYTEVEAPGPSDSARRKQIAAALKGRTPYEVSELVFDWSGKGPKLQVVAVAKETLKQAEEFAVEHRLNPMSFVAIPEPGTFDGEPYFGMTAFAPGHLKAGETVERDPEPILPLVRSLPQAEPEPVPAPEPAAKDAAAAEPAPVTAQASPLPTAAAPAPEPAPSAPAAKAAPEPVTPPAPPPAPPKSEALPVEPGRLAASLMPKPAEVAEPVPEAPFAEVPETLSATDLDDVPDMPGEPPRGGLPDDVPPAPAPSIRVAFASRRSAGEVAAPPLSVPSSVPSAAASAVGRPAGGAIGVPPPIASPATEPPRPRVVRDKPIEDLPPLQRPVFAAPKAPAAQPAPRGAVAKSFGAVMSAPGMPGAKKKAKVAIPSSGAQPAAAGIGAMPGTGAASAGPARTLQPTKPLTKPGGTFGTPPKSGKPRYLGLVLTALLLVFLGLVAAWSSFYLSSVSTPDDGTATAALETGGAAITPPDAVTPEATAAAADGAPGIEDEMLADGELPEGELDPAEVAELPVEAAEAPVDAEADAVAAAVASGSPEVSSSELTVAASNQTEPDASAAAPATETPVADAAPAPLAEPVAETVATAPVAEEPLPPPPGTTISSDVPAAATLTEDQDEIFLAGTDAPPPALDALALPLPEQSGDPPPGAQAPPPPFGTVYQFDERGLIRPTPEGIMTPEGVMLFAGPPPVLPPERPASVLAAAAAVAAPPPAAQPEATAEAVAPADAAAPAPAADPALSGFRPRARPESLTQPSADDAAAPVEFDTQVTSLRPRERPPTVLSASEAARQQSAAASLALQADAVDAAVDVALAGDPSNPSLLAISRRPAARPQDFGRAVGAAVELAVAEVVREPASEPAPEAEEAVALPEGDEEPEVASVARSVPLKGTVAKKATFVNALNLSKVNLIGVYGTDSRRYALVRQTNGRFKKVRVGDRIDGGQVAAITASEVRYQKDGRLVSLKLPRS